ncbi:MAG: uroporphyrinogen-III synthase [Ilumatobacteraceae bacterium]
MTAIPVLRGRRVAITRPDGGELAARLAALGAEVVHVPLIEIAEPADGGAELGGALARLVEFDWLVVTSANGARRVGVVAAGHPDVRLAAVGPATASALGELAGRSVDLVPAVARAEGLLAEFPSSPARVLLAQADRASATLADGLVASGHDVEVVVAYRTFDRRPTPAEVAELCRVDAVLLASGSAAETYAAALGVQPSPVGGQTPIIVAVGPVTAEVARASGLVVDHIAPRPDPETLTTLITTALTATRF